MIDLADIENARNRIAPHVRRTPVVAFDRLHRPLDTGARLSLKLECLQVTGSFKARGAMNRLLGMNEPPGPAGIVTASGGNHGLAVARTAAAAGVPASIYVPTGVSLSKIEKMRAWGASVAFAGSVFDEAAEAAHAHCRRTGAVYFHPFADPLVVAGQGTLGLEIAEDVPDMDAILIAIGGGGLIAGMATALRAGKTAGASKLRIIGVEPEGAPTLKASLDADRVVTLDRITTAVPTMAARRTDERIFDIVRATVDEVVLVRDDEMLEASRRLWFEMGIAADLSGAASLAALGRAATALAGAAHIVALVCGAGPEGTSPQAAGEN